MDEAASNYYVLTIVSLLIAATYYFSFRLHITTMLRLRPVSKTRIRKLMKGKRNYWWYEELHRQCGLGSLYPLNKLFTIAYPPIAVFCLAVGWTGETALVTAALMLALLSLCVIMSAFSRYACNMKEYGQSFVLLRRTRNTFRRVPFDSVVFDLLAALFPLLLAAVLTLGALRLSGLPISWPPL